MSIAEAALYGDLVKYLRDRWAEQAAEFNESMIDEERNRIDELIRSWFFAPRSDLHGLTPREIIRNEELYRPNVVPHDHLDELFDDDCLVCQMMGILNCSLARLDSKPLRSAGTPFGQLSRPRLLIRQNFCGQRMIGGNLDMGQRTDDGLFGRIRRNVAQDAAFIAHIQHRLDRELALAFQFGQLAFQRPHQTIGRQGRQRQMPLHRLQQFFYLRLIINHMSSKFFFAERS
jgi:hypothetical protein